MWLNCTQLLVACVQAVVFVVVGGFTPAPAKLVLFRPRFP